jgi:Uma2 family endonuclease
MPTATRLLTAEEFWSLPSSRWAELIDGVPIEMSPPGPEATGIAATITWLLSTYVRPRALGKVFTDVGTIIRRNPDAVRAPDVAFIRAERVPAGGFPARGFTDVVPDLVVEVVSPGDTAAEVQSKVREWLEAGVRLVWVVYPSSRTVNVARSLLDRETLAVGDVLDGGDVIPGFICPVEDLFA